MRYPCSLHGGVSPESKPPFRPPAQEACCSSSDRFLASRHRQATSDCHQQPEVNYSPCFENDYLPCRLHEKHAVCRANHHSRNRVNGSLQVLSGRQASSDCTVGRTPRWCFFFGGRSLWPLTLAADLKTEWTGRGRGLILWCCALNTYGQRLLPKTSFPLSCPTRSGGLRWAYTRVPRTTLQAGCNLDCEQDARAAAAQKTAAARTTGS